MLNRPLSLLYPLECSSGNLEIHSKKLQPQVPNGANRPYREAKEVAKLKIKENLKAKQSLPTVFTLRVKLFHSETNNQKIDHLCIYNIIHLPVGPGMCSCKDCLDMTEDC